MKTEPIPQLRVRTEFSFRQAFGPIKKVAAALAEMKCPAAGIVDAGTWGHVRWQKELVKAGVKPIFGTELTVAKGDGKKPTAWALAQDTKAFYRFSTAARKPDADIEGLFRQTASGVVRFSGTALTDPDQFDFIDLNPASALQQRAAYALHKRTKKPMVVTSDNSYPTPGDYAAFMAFIDREKVTPQHILTEAELRKSIGFLSDTEFRRAIGNARDIAHTCAGALPTAPLIQVPGDLRALAYAGRDERVAKGHIESWTQEYADRLERELVAIEAKEFQSYFLVVADLISWSKERMLVGPGRGSSAGSLLCYCTRITEVDPIPHKLLFERFIDLTRKDLPDIDIDFNDTKREQVFEYLTEKYHFNNVARLGSINTLKPRSVMLEICKRFGIAEHEKFDLLNVLIEYSSGDARYGKGLLDTLENTETGRKFASRHPKAAVMGEIENHASHTGVHAAGVIVCNDPVSDYCTIGAEGVAHLDKPDAEALNLLKIDALGLRTLGILEDAGVATNEELYALKLDDPKVFDVFNEHRYSAVFQFEGTAQRQISSEVEISSFATIDHLTALARPGPLGGGATQKYIERKKYNQGHSAWKMKPHEHFIEPLLRDTYGVVLYQEQVMQIVRQIGKFSWEETTTIRKAMSGRKGEEYFNQQETKFIAGAAHDGIGEHDARAIWKEICAFGAWGMNKSHTCAYAVISYWCVSGKTTVFDWENEVHIPISRAFKDGIKSIACYDERTGQTVAGRVKKIVRTTGEKNVNLKLGWKLKTKSGRRIVCSEDHEILTRKGFKPLRDICVGDEVACEKRPEIHTKSVRESMSKSLAAHWQSLDESERMRRVAAMQAPLSREKRSKAAAEGWAQMNGEKRRQLGEALLENKVGGGWVSRSVGTTQACGHRHASKNEKAVCDWLNANGIAHESQVPIGRKFADWRINGVFVEFDGLGRGDEYFDDKFGDEPYVVITDISQLKDKLSFAFEVELIKAGGIVIFDKVTSIEKTRPIVMYDIVMESEPHNFLANGIVVHNCGWMKRYHPLEYAAACLRNAKDDDQQVAVLKEMSDEGVKYLPFDPMLSQANWSVQRRKLVGGFTNIKGIGPAKATKAIEQRDYLFAKPAKGLSEKDLAKLQKKQQDWTDKWGAMVPKFKDLYPLRTAYQDMYLNPHNYGIAEGSKILMADEFPVDGNVLWLARLDEKKRRDELEQRRVVKRGGRVLTGPTAFVDLVCKDDTNIPIICRIGRYDFEEMGRAAIEHLINKQDVLLMRGKRVPGFSMIRVDKIKCLTRPEVLMKGYTSEQSKA